MKYSENGIQYHLGIQNGDVGEICDPARGSQTLRKDRVPF